MLKFKVLTKWKVNNGQHVMKIWRSLLANKTDVQKAKSQFNTKCVPLWLPNKPCSDDAWIIPVSSSSVEGFDFTHPALSESVPDCHVGQVGGVPRLSSAGPTWLFSMCERSSKWRKRFSGARSLALNVYGVDVRCLAGTLWRQRWPVEMEPAHDVGCWPGTTEP